MAKQDKLPDGVQALIQRHAAVEGTEIGIRAISSMKKLTNIDISQNIFQVGDQFTIPHFPLLEKMSFVASINDNKIPAVAIQCTNGQAKVLYLPTLKKSVVEYEETKDGIQTKKNLDGSIVVHFADTPIRSEILAKGTVIEILRSIAGRTFRVTSIMGPYKTSRIRSSYDKWGNRVYEIIGLRETTIPVFTEIQETSDVLDNIGNDNKRDVDAFIDKANQLMQDKGLQRISFNELYKGAEDSWNLYGCYSFNNQIRINVDYVGFSGKAQDLKKLLDSNYQPKCLFDLELKNSKGESFYIKGENIRLSITEPSWWIVDVVESGNWDDQLEDVGILCCVVIRVGQFEFVDNLINDLRHWLTKTLNWNVVPSFPK